MCVRNTPSGRPCSPTANDECIFSPRLKAAELACERRNRYRTIMVMILSEATHDLRLAHSMIRFFDEYQDFRSLQRIRELDVEAVLKRFGIGRNKTGNGRRFQSILRLQPWLRPFEAGDVAKLADGFGNKFRKVLLAYVFGKRNVLPLDTPAFHALQEQRFYTHLTPTQIDRVRDDIEEKLGSVAGVSLIDFHELLRFRKQAGLASKNRLTLNQKKIILGWNGWRVLCLNDRSILTANWVEHNLIKDTDLAAEFAVRFAGLKRTASESL